MKFIDSNLFIYAFYKPKNELLDQKKKDLKNISKLIVSRINEGEKVKKILISGQEMAIDSNIDLNDGIAVTIMQEMNVDEIYSFDSHFDNFKWITRLKR